MKFASNNIGGNEAYTPIIAILQIFEIGLCFEYTSFVFKVRDVFVGIGASVLLITEWNWRVGLLEKMGGWGLK